MNSRNWKKKVKNEKESNNNQQFEKNKPKDAEIINKNIVEPEKSCIKNAKLTGISSLEIIYNKFSTFLSNSSQVQRFVMNQEMNPGKIIKLEKQSPSQNTKEIIYDLRLVLILKKV